MVDDRELSVSEIRELYRPRIIDYEIEKYLSVFGGVLIVGPKWCGKSWTGINHSKSEIFLGKGDTKRLALLEPEAVLRKEYPLLVDEWQEAPNLWDVARMNIDFSRRSGLYIFTGSTTPPSQAVSHSGTGRFVRLKMHTLSLYESGNSDGHVSLSKLFDGIRPDAALSPLNFSAAVDLIYRGGWPKAVGRDDAFANEIPKAYVTMVSEEDMSRVDGVKRSSAIAKKLLLSLARNTATSASIKTLANDIGERGERPSDSTVNNYLDALRKLFLVEEQFGWNPNLRSTVRIQSSPRRHLADPSIAASLLCKGPGELRQDPNTAGFLFESMCYRDLCVYASAIGGDVFYYRDDDGLEVDFVIQLNDGRWGMAEAKLGVYEFDKAARNLLKVKDKVAAAGSRDPSFMIILNATGGMVHTRPDGITEVPVDRFGP